MTTLDHLAASLDALEAIDSAPFQRRARVLQSIWRSERGYACGTHGAGNKSRPLGSRLPMPWAREELANFLTDGVREVVRAEVIDPAKSRGKLFGKPRIFNDLLSSQPLCFNLFAELRSDLALASKLIAHFTAGRFSEVVAIEFEHAPAPIQRYTGDRSAFDVLLECRSARGAHGFLGIEVKYHENLAGTAASHKPRYEEIAAQMGCFRADAMPALRRQPLQQLWRDHLLSGAMRAADGFDDAQFVVLYPKDNEACRRAVDAYRDTLSDASGFGSWLLEDVLDFSRTHATKEWPSLVFDRYCDFSKVDRRLEL